MSNPERSNSLLVWGFLALCALVVYFKMGPSGGPSPEASTAGTTVRARADQLEIVFSTSDGKKDWIEKATAQFHKRNVVVEGKTVAVKHIHMRSGESMQAILAGTEKPTLWSPVSESWFNLINGTWQLRHGKKLIPAWRPTVSTALVLAIWEPMARTLGWPTREIGWEEIARVALDAKGWESMGHPEWGLFKFGHAHPDFSTSAMLSVISEIYAAAGKRAGLVDADFKNPRVAEWVRAIEHSIVHYGKSSSWLTMKLCTKGPGYLSATPVYEASVIQANLKYPDKPFKLIALYPKEGTFWESHPAGIVEADWVTPAQAQAARAYLEFLASREIQAMAVGTGFRPTDPSVPLGPPFDPEHGVDPKASPKGALEQVSDDIFKRANELWHQVKKKASITVVLDTSGSMSGKPMESAKKGLIELIKHMEKEDEVRLVTFSDKIHVLASGKVSEVGERAIGQVAGLYADGGTSLYDVLSEAYRNIDSVGPRRREERLYGIVVLSDGKDTTSKTGRADVLAMLPKGTEVDAIRIYTIAYGKDADLDFLKEVSERTNAVMFKGEAKDIQQVYLDISAYF